MRDPSEHPLVDHPPFGLLLGGIPGICAVRYGLGPGNSGLLLSTAVLSLVLDVLILNGRRRADLPGLVCLGFGGFALLTLWYWSPYHHQRRWLRNRRVHLSGRLPGKDGSRYAVHRINHQRTRALFYLPEGIPSHVEADDETREDGPGGLAMTATVRWPHDSPGFANYLAANRYLGYLEVHRLFGPGEPPPVGVLSGVGIHAALRDGLRTRSRRWPLSSRFLRALVLGERNALPKRVDVLLRRLGLSHLFVISGLHVGLLYLLLVGLLDRLRTPDRWFLPLTGIFLLLYLSFLGWPISATRAGVMVLLLEVTRSGLRRCSYAEVLLSTVLVLLAYDPLMFFRIGFQLSVAAVGGIILLRERSWIRLRRPWARWMMINVGAFLGVLPLLMFHFHVGSAWGWMSSFLAGAVFPGFLGILTLQGLLVGTGWTTPADLVERLFQSGLDLAWESLGDLPLMVGVGGLSIWGVLGCWLLTWLLLSRVSGRGVRAAALVVLSGTVLLLAAAPRKPLTEIGTVGGMGFVRIRTAGGRRIVILDPDRSLTPRRMRSLDRALLRRGVSHLHTVVGFTDCRRIRKTVVTLSFGRCRSREDGGGPVRWPEGRFSPESGNLRLPYVTVNLNPHEADEPLARAGRFCLYRSPAESSDRAGAARSCTPVEVGETPMVWRPDRPPQRGPGNEESVEGQLLDGLHTLFTLIQAREGP